MEKISNEDLLFTIPSFTMSYVGDCDGLGLIGISHYIVTVPLDVFNNYIKNLSAKPPLNLVKHDVKFTDDRCLLKTWCTDKFIIHAIFRRNGNVEIDLFYLNSDKEFKYVIDILDVVDITLTLFRRS
ncbi:hypothetical protein CKG00_18360 [Morganella morganii]|uniref:Uncharacterized protein n=1 Tax=Morganella morganii TaxID=582 RepID=A0A433ZPQ1_MORMO|nr:hypothetical protein [Morganella morganii]RUT64097.1 hypothetical protein CKG00_18360 [Morganella morganii]